MRIRRADFGINARAPPDILIKAEKTGSTLSALFVQLTVAPTFVNLSLMCIAGGKSERERARKHALFNASVRRRPRKCLQATKVDPNSRRVAVVRHTRLSNACESIFSFFFFFLQRWATLEISKRFVDVYFSSSQRCYVASKLHTNLAVLKGSSFISSRIPRAITTCQGFENRDDGISR